MPKISHRGQHAIPSPIRFLAPYAKAAENRGLQVHYLNIGQPDILTPASAIAHLKNTDIQVLKYSPSAGWDSYREKLTEYYARFEMNVEKEDLIVTTGASEAISLVLNSCLDYDDEVILPEPFYANYLGFAHAAGIRIRPLTCHIENAFALPAVDDFERLITPKTKAVMLCNPNNPTGGIYNRESLEALGRLAKRHDLYLIVDEVYREFCYDEAFFSVLRLEGLEANTIVIDSISKRFSACGARIGSIVSKNRAVINTCLTFAQLRLSPPGLGQILAEATLDLPTTYLDEVKATYQNRRDVLINRLKNMAGVTAYLPAGAFYAFAKLPVPDTRHFCQWLLEDFDHRGETVMLAPGAGFYATPNCGLDEVRIAYILNTEAIDRAMDCLEAGLEVYQKEVLAKVVEGKRL